MSDSEQISPALRRRAAERNLSVPRRRLGSTTLGLSRRRVIPVKVRLLSP